MADPFQDDNLHSVLDPQQGGGPAYDPVLEVDNGAELAGPSTSTGKKTRSREGCLICRTRRIKCDNGKPDCARCIKYGAECIYPAKKRFDQDTIAASLSRRHRKAGGGSEGADEPFTAPGLAQASSSDFDQPFNDHSTLADAGSFPHGQINNGPHPSTPLQHAGTAPQMPLGIFDVDELMAFFKQTQMGAFFRQRVDPPEFLRPAFPDPDELRCFHHAVTYSFSICVTREDFNPWVQHIAPLFLFPDGQAPLSAEAVRWAMLRIGAIHLSYLNKRDTATLSDGSYERDLAARYRANCLGLLRRARQVEMEGVSDTFGAALMMFFFGEILSAGTQWHEPYRMIRDTVQRRGGFACILFGLADDEVPSSLKQYMVEQLVWLELIGSDLQSQMPALLSGDLSWFDRLGSIPRQENEIESIEATFGVNREIYRLSMTHGLLIGQTEHAERSYTNGQVGTALPDSALVAQWVQDMHAWRARGLPTIMDNRTRLGSIAVWHACMMGYYRVIEKRGRGDGEVQLCAVSVLDAVVEAGEKVEFILWPLMVAGCNLLSPVLRARCRELLKSFQYQCCYELEVGMRVLEETWIRVDAGADQEACDWREIMVELGCTSFFG